MATFKKFFPARHEILLVLGAALFVIHSWSLNTFIYKVPSFLLYMNLGQIGTVFAYMMAFAFLESLLVTSGLVVTSALLPRSWYRDGFHYKGFLTLLVGTISAIFLQDSLNNQYPGATSLLIWVSLTLLSLIALLLLVHFVESLRKFIIFIAEQVSVMLYLYLPIGLVSLLIIIWRIFL